MEQLDFFRPLLGKASAPAFVPKQPEVAVRKLENSEDPALTILCGQWLQALGCGDLADRVRVRWNSRMQSTAGLAYPAKALIKLNPRLQAFGPAEVEKTLKHELAHLLAHHRVGRRRIAPHGSEWRKACADLGLADEKRCHNLPLPRRQVSRQHQYRCPACGASVHRVRPLRRPSACLPCCRKHNGGSYDERFRFVKVRPKKAEPS